MDFRGREIDFREADRRYAELKRQHEARDINNEQFDEQLKELMVQDEEGRWWAKARETGRWHYHDGNDWIPGTPPGYHHTPPQTLPMDRAADHQPQPEQAEPSPSKDKTFIDDLTRICAKYIGPANYRVGEAIPQKRLTNARSSFSIPDTENAWLLYSMLVLSEATRSVSLFARMVSAGAMALVQQGGYGDERIEGGETVRVEITDESGGLAYIRLAEGEIVGTKEVAPGVILDYAADKQIVGIEVLYLDKPGIREAPDLSLKTFLESVEGGKRKAG